MEDVAAIELIHSKWIECERAGDVSGVLALCSDEIEFRPPNAPVVAGRAAVSAYLETSRAQELAIEISERRIRVADSLAVLTAHYRTSFGEQAMAGDHLWILERRREIWRVTLVTWSGWQE